MLSGYAYLGLSISKCVTKSSDRGWGLVGGARGVITSTATTPWWAETEPSRSRGCRVLPVMGRRGCGPISNTIISQIPMTLLAWELYNLLWVYCNCRYIKKCSLGVWEKLCQALAVRTPTVKIPEFLYTRHPLELSVSLKKKKYLLNLKGFPDLLIYCL